MNNFVKVVRKLFVRIKRFLTKWICWTFSELDIERIDLLLICQETMKEVDKEYRFIKNRPTYRFSIILSSSLWHAYLDMDKEFLPFVRTTFNEIEKVDDLIEKEDLFNKIMTRFKEIIKEYNDRFKPRPNFLFNE